MGYFLVGCFLWSSSGPYTIAALCMCFFVFHHLFRFTLVVFCILVLLIFHSPPLFTPKTVKKNVFLFLFVLPFCPTVGLPRCSMICMVALECFCEPKCPGFLNQEANLPAFRGAWFKNRLGLYLAISTTCSNDQFTKIRLWVKKKTPEKPQVLGDIFLSKRGF